MGQTRRGQARAEISRAQISRRDALAWLGAGLALPALGADLRAQTVMPPGIAGQPIISDWPRRQPIFAPNGMVASQEAGATMDGVGILKEGGNAVDAAVCVAFSLAATLPRAGNIGGGGFMLIHRADRRRTIAIDYRETAPASARRDMFLNAAGEADPTLSQRSGLAIGIPGTVAGMAMALERYGSGRFTLADLMTRAIAHAAGGFPVPDDLAFSLGQARERIGRHAATRAIFFRPDGETLRREDRLVQKDLAETLRLIAARGPDAFYRGPVAEKMVAAVNAIGGQWTLDDLAGYRAIEREVVTGTYRGYEIASMPPPSSGGVHLIQILNILEGFDLKAAGHNSAAMIHLFAEASKLAYADRSAYLGDPAFFSVPVKGLTSKRYAETLRRLIDPARARPGPEIRPGQPQPFESDQTTHFAVIDQEGNVVSNTYTLNFSYGVGMVAAGTGILMNNELDDFAAKPGVPNAYGLIGGDANAPGAGKRPLSSMSPTIVFRDGRPFMATGSPGGPRIITTVLQIISNVIDHGMNIAEATEAVRVHHQWLPDELRIERGLSIDTIRLLEARGHTVAVRQAMGSAQSILVTPEGLHGAMDLRQAGTLALGH